MAEIALAATVSHAPGITGWPEAAGEQGIRFYAGMAKIREALQAAQPDAIIEIFNDHFTNFYNHMPAMCVGVGASHFGPAEPESFLRMPRRPVPGDPDLAWALAREAFNSGFDLSISHELLLDHGAMVPLHFLTPSMNVPVVPVIVNDVLEPMPLPRRVYQLGRLIRKVVESRPKGERVALLGTGGLSHWVGTPEMGRIDKEWDEWFLETAEEGRGKELVELTPEELGKHGNGAHELRNWMAVYGAIGDQKGEITTYEAAMPWFCACGAVLYRV